MGGLFGGDTPTPEPIPEPPSRSDAEIQSAALDARMRRASATGRAETILTSGQGVDEDKSTKVTKLLGSG